MDSHPENPCSHCGAPIDAPRADQTAPKRFGRRLLLLLTGVGAGASLGLGLRAQGPVAGPLRPPGAGSEEEFLAACIRCGQCVAVCPVDALQNEPTDRLAAMAAPSISSPRTSPCNLCQGHDELLCIATCPTAALTDVADWRDVRIGVAIINRDLCLPWNGVTCRACWHACPFPNEAIRLDWRARPEIVAEACVGCGLCAQACLSDPGSIEVRSMSAWREGTATHTGGATETPEDGGR